MDAKNKYLLILSSVALLLILSIIGVFYLTNPNWEYFMLFFLVSGLIESFFLWKQIRKELPYPIMLEAILTSIFFSFIITFGLILLINYFIKQQVTLIIFLLITLLISFVGIFSHSLMSIEFTKIFLRNNTSQNYAEKLILAKNLSANKNSFNSSVKSIGITIIVMLVVGFFLTTMLTNSMKPQLKQLLSQTDESIVLGDLSTMQEVSELEIIKTLNAEHKNWSKELTQERMIISTTSQFLEKPLIQLTLSTLEGELISKIISANGAVLKMNSKFNSVNLNILALNYALSNVKRKDQQLLIDTQEINSIETDLQVQKQFFETIKDKQFSILAQGTSADMDSSELKSLSNQDSKFLKEYVTLLGKTAMLSDLEKLSDSLTYLKDSEINYIYELESMNDNSRVGNYIKKVVELNHLMHFNEAYCKTQDLETCYNDLKVTNKNVCELVKDTSYYVWCVD